MRLTMLAAMLVTTLTVPAVGRVGRVGRADDGPAPTFQKDVLPVLAEKCNRCHGEKQKGGRLDLRTRAAMLTGGNTGPAIEFGNPEKSLLIELIVFNEMPPRKESPRIDKTELDLLRRWIAAGAPESPK